MIWRILDYFDKDDSWGDANKMDPMLLILMEKIRCNLPQGCGIKIHCGYKINGRENNSLHYQGKAADFHVIGIDFLTAESLIIDYLYRRRLIDFVGFGIYPDWEDPGFHLDIRGTRKSWARTDTGYMPYADGLKYAKGKFK
jgi:uncharacterized protein YcbK (DUF882 family)